MKNNIENRIKLEEELRLMEFNQYRMMKLTKNCDEQLEILYKENPISYRKINSILNIALKYENTMTRLCGQKIKLIEELRKLDKLIMKEYNVKNKKSK